jgi:hypothetical protein
MPYDLYLLQSIERGSNLLLIAPFSSSKSFREDRSILSDFCLLQQRCASCRLSMSLGCPPLSTGMIWSMHGDNGSGKRLVKSTGLPHIPHSVLVANIFLLFDSNCVRCTESWSGLLARGITPSFGIYGHNKRAAHPDSPLSPISSS